MPLSMPMASCSTLATGARQLVVQEALEIDEMLLRDLVVIDAVDDRDVGAVAGRRDQHALGAGGEQLRGLVARGEEARAFQRDVDVQLFVGQFGRVLDRRDLDRPAPGVDRVAGDRHLVRKAAMHRVVAQQMGVGLDGAEIVDRHDLEVGAAGLDDIAQHVAPDASESVDRHSQSHGSLR